MIDLINITWTTADILKVASDLNPRQCSKVLEMMLEEHDSNEGINWDIIEGIVYRVRLLGIK